MKIPVLTSITFILASSLFKSVTSTRNHTEITDGSALTNENVPFNPNDVGCGGCQSCCGKKMDDDCSFCLVFCKKVCPKASKIPHGSCVGKVWRKSLKVKESSTLDSRTLRLLNPDQIVILVDRVIGNKINGNKFWFKLKSTGFVPASGIKIKNGSQHWCRTTKNDDGHVGDEIEGKMSFFKENE